MLYTLQFSFFFFTSFALIAIIIQQCYFVCLIVYMQNMIHYMHTTTCDEHDKLRYLISYANVTCIGRDYMVKRLGRD